MSGLAVNASISEEPALWAQDAPVRTSTGFVHHSNLVSSRFLPTIKNEQIGFLSFAPSSWPCITYLEEAGSIPPPSPKRAVLETSK